jgi:hypothetical protein
MARKKEEVGRPFTVRIRSAQLAEIEAWMAREGEAGLSHQKAILRLVAAGIHDVKNSPEVTDVITPSAPNPPAPAKDDRLAAIVEGLARKGILEHVIREGLRVARNAARAPVETAPAPEPEPQPAPAPLTEISEEGEEKVEIAEPAPAPERASPSGWRREGRDLVSGGGAMDALLAEINAIKFDDPPEITEGIKEEVVEKLRN